jgi:nitrate reductase beta subunit
MASREQATGVAQVNQAMNQVDQVTQRNATAAEELSHTAKEMASKAMTLQQLMSFFHIETPTFDANRMLPMTYETPPTSPTAKETDRRHRERQPRDRFQPLDHPQNPNGELAEG